MSFLEDSTITIAVGWLGVMLEIIGFSIFFNVILIRNRLKLIKTGRIESKKYIFTCSPKGENKK